MSAPLPSLICVLLLLPLLLHLSICPSSVLTSCSPIPTTIATTTGEGPTVTFDLQPQPLRSCTSDCQCTKAYGKEARCISSRCYCLSSSSFSSSFLFLSQASPLESQMSTTSLTTATSPSPSSAVAQDCYRLAESRFANSPASSWSELVSSQREAERSRITWAAVFIFIICAIAAIFHVYKAD